MSELAKAQLAVMKKCKYLQKKRGGLRYTFASEADAIAQLRPHMVEAGIVMTPVGAEFLHAEQYGATAKGGSMSLVLGRYRFKFTHAPSGESEVVEVLGEGGAADDKRASKASTSAKKYALLQFFLIETGDDPDYVQTVNEDADKIYAVAANSIRQAKGDPQRLQVLREQIHGKSRHKFNDEQVAELDRLLARQE